jgi:hypothetical protein
VKIRDALKFELQYQLQKIVAQNGLISLDNPKVASVIKNLQAVGNWK